MEGTSSAEQIILCIDVCPSNLDGDVAWNWWEQMKHQIVTFITIKQRMSPHHKFALCSCSEKAVWLCDFTSELASLSDLVYSLEHQMPAPRLDMSSVATIISDNVNFLDTINTRVIFIYGRTDVIPEFSDGMTQWSKLINIPSFFFDIVYLVSTCATKEEMQRVFNVLSGIDIGKGNCYLFQSPPSRLYNPFLMLLANSKYRIKQEDFCAALSLSSKRS